MITLAQDTDGFIRMDRHLPESLSVNVTFADGSSEVLTGAVLNKAYDDAFAAFREKNGLDAKGFSRRSNKPFGAGNKINFVPVRPGMGN